MPVRNPAPKFGKAGGKGKPRPFVLYKVQQEFMRFPRKIYLGNFGSAKSAKEKTVGSFEVFVIEHKRLKKEIMFNQHYFKLAA